MLHLHSSLTGWHRNRYPSEVYCTLLYMEIAMAMAMAMVFVVVLLLCLYDRSRFSAMPFSVAGN